MNAQSPCSFDWTDGLEKYPVYCRKEDGMQGKDSMVNSFVLNTVSGSEALTIFLPLACTIHLIYNLVVQLSILKLLPIDT